jgi:dimethylargininase
VESVAVRNILHLKSACSYIGNNTLLISPRFLDTAIFEGFELIDVPDEEPGAANALRLDESVILAASFPATAALLKNRGFDVITVDVSELQKAEAGVTCCSLIFSNLSTEPR